jgi:hypothetical protein
MNMLQSAANDGWKSLSTMLSRCRFQRATLQHEIRELHVPFLSTRREFAQPESGGVRSATSPSALTATRISQ